MPTVKEASSTSELIQSNHDNDDEANAFPGSIRWYQSPFVRIISPAIYLECVIYLLRVRSIIDETEMSPFW